MKYVKTLARGAIWGALGVGLLGSCQSIAGVEDVEFLESSVTSVECVEYCDLMLEACPGDLSVYEDGTCEATCRTFDASDTSIAADTLACRLDQANQARRADTSEKAPHCSAAGPGGGGVCTTETKFPDCEGYCSLYMNVCKSISKDWGFGKQDDCIQKCSALTPAGEYSAKSAPESGDTLACRLFYASRAAVEPSEENCKSASLYPHAENGCKPIGEPDCDHYCSVVEVACIGTFDVYETFDQCKQVCAKTDPGLVSDSGGQDTVGCRTYHAYNALALNSLPHCSHSGPAGNGVCSFTKDTTDANCIPYCRLAAAGCEERFDERYEDEAACLADCANFEGALPDSGVNAYTVALAQRGDTLQCRILNAARALEHTDPDDKATFCSGAFGGAPCKD